MRAPILDQPLIAVAAGHVEKVDRYHGDNRPIRTGDIAHGKQRIGDRDIGLDEADPVVGERRLRAPVNGLRLGALNRSCELRSKQLGTFVRFSFPSP